MLKLKTAIADIVWLYYAQIVFTKSVLTSDEPEFPHLNTPHMGNALAGQRDEVQYEMCAIENSIHKKSLLAT